MEEFKYDIKDLFVNSLNKYKKGKYSDHIHEQAIFTLLENLPKFEFDFLDKSFKVYDKKTKLELIDYFIDYLIKTEAYEVIIDMKKIQEYILNEK